MLGAEKKQIEDAIRCGGLAPSKASCIKGILDSLSAKRGKLCLEYLRDLSIDEIKAELSYFKGIGPKTVIIYLLVFLLNIVSITIYDLNWMECGISHLIVKGRIRGMLHKYDKVGIKKSFYLTLGAMVFVLNIIHRNSNCLCRD